MVTLQSTAPAKVILFGEHAVNRGAPALAVSIELRATCTLRQAPRDDGIHLVGGGQAVSFARAAALELGRTIDAHLAAGRYDAVQEIAAANFFAPHQYALAALGEELPTFAANFESSIPPSAGLGSGGAAFVALAASVLHLLRREASPREIAVLARRGDVVAHGGIASGLDTQTSIYGGAIRYTAEHEGEPIAYADGLRLVIGNTHIFAATSAVNGRVRRWLAAAPVRNHYFQEIGLLARQAEAALHGGEWAELGHLMNLNQLILERIGVSCPELERLNDAALAAGAFGAKLSGSGGGGIMVALVAADAEDPVARAITDAGGQAIVVPVGVLGVITGEAKKE